MKLKSKNSFLKRISCIALSLMLCLTSFSLAGFVPTLEAEAATSKTLMHYTFDDSSYSIGSKLSTPDGKSYPFYNWQNGHTVGNGYYYNRDGGFYGNFTALSGKNNWVFTYKGYSENLGNDGDCEIGLGTAEDNTNVIRISSNGKIFVNNEGKAKAQGSLNYSSSATYDSSKVNTIKFKYFKDQMYVTINNNSFGPYTVSTGNNVNSIYTGVNCSNAVTTDLLGTRYHYVDDIVATTVDDTCVTKADFETAFTNFENKISNTKLYTNIKPAYDAYVNARKVYDAYYYGNDITLTNISDALLELEAQTAKLTTEWQSPTGTAVPYFNAGTVQSSAYSNLLYSNKVDGYQNFEKQHSYGSGCIIYHRIVNNQTVMLYDGISPLKMPVIYISIIEKTVTSGTKERSPYMVYPTTSDGNIKDLGDLYLVDKWKGYTENKDQYDSTLYNFETIYGKTDNYVGHNSSTMNEGKNMSKGYGKGYSHYFAYANVLAYDNSISFVNDKSGAYSKKYKLYWCFRSEAKSKTNISDLKNITGYQGGNDNAAIYVVNYKPLRDAIVNAKSNIPNKLNNVKQGGLSTYLNTLNTLMSYNPNSSFSGVSSVTDGINNFNSAMTTNMTKARKLTSNAITSDNSAYDTIRDEIDKYKTIKNNVEKGLNFYKADTLSAYDTAYDEAKAVMADVDTNGYKPASNSTPNDKAQALKTAREKLIEIFKVTFKNKDGRVVDTREIEKGNRLGEFPANTAPTPDSSFPDKGHNVYYWNKSFTKDSVPTTDVTIDELQGSQLIGHSSKTPATCTTKQTCDACGAEFGSYGDHTFTKKLEVRVEPGPVTNGYTYIKCDNCEEKDQSTFSYDDVTSNWTNYKNQLEVCETELSNTAKYTADSIASVRSTVDSIKEDVKGNGGFGNEALSAGFIDGKTRSLMEALPNLKIAKYKVTLHFKNENGDNLNIPGLNVNYKDSEEISYGNMTLVEIPKAFEDNGYSVIKWARIGENTDIIHGLNSSSLNVVVKKNMEYAVYLKKTTVDDNQASGNAVITLNNKSNKVVDIGYVPMEPDGTATIATVTINGNEITIGGVKLTAPKYSFYDLDGFEIDGKHVASGQTITLNSKMVIKPVYTPSRKVTITRETGSNFLINGKDDNSVQVEWNKKIVTSTRDGSSVVWKTGFDYDKNGTIEESEKNVVAYGSTYSFYSNSDVTIFAEDIAAPTDPTASIGYFDYDSTLNKVTVVNNFFVPEGKKAVKAGVVLSTKTNDRETLINQTTGRFEGTEKDFSGTDTNKNQIRISVTRTANTSFTMHALAYVVVEDENGKKDTYFAPTVRSITYTATKA